MACVPLTSLMNTIHFEFLQPRPPVILDEDTSHMVSSLYQNLCFLLAFLEELVKKSGIDEATIKDLEAKIRDFVFIVEDEVESNLATIYKEVADKEMTLFPNLQEVLGEDAEMILFQNLREVAEKTQNFVNGIKREYNDSAVQDLAKVHALPLDIGSEHESEYSHERISKIEDRMVGRTSEINTIRDQLIRGRSGEPKVIPILGMGGIGKTTLARRVYEEVVSHFDLRAWATVSQEVNMKPILCNLLLSINRGMNIDGSADELAHKLRQGLMSCQRYLIVVDDVWETSVWDRLAGCFPESDGSAILVTTRQKKIADYTTSGASNLLHKLHFLDSNESWDLFCSHIILKQPLHSKLETIRRNIVDKCGGLPLAIVVAARLLSRLSKVEELENIEEEMSYLASTDIGEQCSRILIVSYNHLPQHLKACFLYLAVFSAGSEIPVKKLVRLWIAEGFVKSMRNKELEEVAVGYLHDLISRSLVQIDKLKCDGQIKTCRMHHLLHGLCERQATNEKLLCNISKNVHGTWGWQGFRSLHPNYFEPFSSSKKACDACRWLSFRSSKPEHFDPCYSSSKARSILCLRKDEMPPRVNDPMTVNFRLLIVLDLTSPLYYKGINLSLLDHLSNIVLLRYLAFEIDRSLGFEGLKNVLSKNKKLHTLIVSHSAIHRQVNYSLLPSTIWRSPHLRHVEFRNFFRVEAPSIVKEDLQILYWLSIFHCTEEVISRIPNVKTLGIFCEDRLILDDGVSCNDAISLKNLCYLNQLEVLTIEAEYAIPKRMSLPSIDALPSNLRKLKLSKTYLPWKDNIATIALLPRLEVLKLKMDAFYGPEWEPTEGGFRQLKFLLLENTELEIWNAFEDDFPKLERLVLKCCERLKEIPSSFSNITSLQSIDFEWCKPALLTCAKNIQEERYTYGYDDFAVIDRTPQYSFEQSMSKECLSKTKYYQQYYQYYQGDGIFSDENPNSCSIC